MFTSRLSLASSIALTSLSIFIACQSRKSNGEPTMPQNISPQDVRRPAVAGSWYSNDPDELSEELRDYMAHAQNFNLPEIVGLVSPHAGYVYSGPVAAYAYRQVEGQNYDVVVVIAPSHAEGFPFASVYARGGYQTPLGVIPVDTSLARAIAANRRWVKAGDRGHRQETLGRQEHSLEIQLPFLQLALGDFKLVPIVMGDQNEEVVHELAKALAASLKGKHALLVASSDLSHYHPYDDANKIDAGVLRRVERFETDSLLHDLNGKKVEACGGGPICAVMEASRLLGADKSKVLKHANSGDVPQGDKHGVVGYMAAAFYHSAGSETKPAAKLSRGEAEPLSAQDRRILMHIARSTIEAVVQGKEPPHVEVNSPSLLEDRGAFVTIKKEGNLRGCIGYIIGIKPLYQTVREVAEWAALRDPRFDPVRPEELPFLQLEISALSAPRRITDTHEIQVGVHGIIMRRSYRQGLLLPQVAAEYGWDRQTFLEQTCRKAGLPPNAWKDEETEIEIFSAEVFGEE
jgi:AmmeMemoRadiSam system protein B/AmmeMemoRadiSam system protein A